MSHGRHSKPHATGGGLATLLALAVAGGAVALAGGQPTSTVLRYCVVGLALLSSCQLLMMARNQRTSTRAMARTEERLRTLEQRNREEGDQLHRRVLAGVAREGELSRSVEVLVEEISRLRAALQSFVPIAAPLPATAATDVAVAVEPDTAVPGPAETFTTVDIPLIQRVLAAQEEPAVAPEPAAAAPEPVQPAAAAAFPGIALARPVLDTPWLAPSRPGENLAPAAGELWRAPSRPEHVPAAAPTESPGTSWVVREIQLGTEPGAALSMRILDLTTPSQLDGADQGAEQDEPMGSWTHFARPA